MPFWKSKQPARGLSAGLCFPGRCPSAGFAFPPARGNASPGERFSPQAARSICPSPQPYPAVQASGPAKADAAVQSLLNANAGHKAWENTQIWLQGGEEEQWAAGNGEEMENWEDVMCDCFPPSVILWVLLLNAGEKPFRRMRSTTLQHFPLLPAASAECRAVFGGTEIWRVLRPSSIHPLIPATPTRGVSPPGSSKDPALH